MKSFKDYLAESARIAEAPITEDYFDFELMGCIIESEVIEHDEDSITVLVDEHAMSLLDSQGMLEADDTEEDFPLMRPGEKYMLDNPRIVKVTDTEDGYSITGANDRQTGMLRALTGSTDFPKRNNNWINRQNSARTLGYILQYVGNDPEFDASFQGTLPSKEPMMKAKGDLPDQAISPMAEMLKLAGLSEGILDKIKGAFGKSPTTNAPAANPTPAPQAAKPAGNYSGQLNGTKLVSLIGYKKGNDIGERLGKKAASKVVAQFPDGNFYDITLDQGQFRVVPSKQSQEGWYGYAIQKQGNAQVRAPSMNFNADTLGEAEYQGRKVPLGKPMRGDVKKFKVYVKDPSTGNVKKVNFGDPNMRIKKSNPARRKSFRARHNCANPGPRTKARYWSCRKW